MSKKLFISHSTKDDAQVDLIADALEAAGFTVWVDHRHGIEAGMPNWEKAIREAIIEADAGIFLMSENSLTSDICAAECLLVRELGDPLYVMRLEACKPENIWLYIKQIQYADLVKDFDQGINDLIRVLGGETSEELPKAVRVAFTGLDTMRLYLPYLNNPLRGRDEDIKQIQSKLGGHVLQIVGPGGLGKSRLAAEIAMNQSNGAIWHRCSPVSEPAELVALLREHLKLPADASLTNVLALLSEKKPLIVVDNAEDVPDGSDKRRAYADLLHQIVGRGVPVILTTRAVWTELKPRPDYAPAALSLEIAAQIALDFAAAEDVALSESQACELAEKARLHPRLIEFSVGQLHERRLDSVLRQLSELKHADIKEALDEMITKTVEQMAEQADNGADAETLLVRMPILQATFPLKAIEALAPEEMKDDSDRLEDVLVTLQKWQFVRRDRTTERYTLGELVREALGQPEDDVFSLYADYYTTRAIEIFDLPSEQWKEHEHDLPNILALGNMLISKMIQEIPFDPAQLESKRIFLERILKFSIYTREFVTSRLEYRNLSWLEIGVAAAKTLERKQEASILLNAVGLVEGGLGNNQAALRSYFEALAFLKDLQVLDGQAPILNNIGMLYGKLGDRRSALRYIEMSLVLNQAMGDQQGIATALNNIGMQKDAIGEKQKALKYFHDALEIIRKDNPPNWYSEAATLNNIGLVWDSLHDWHKARELYEEAIVLVSNKGDIGIEAATLTNLGAVLDMLGRHEDALQKSKQALKLFKQIGDRKNEGATLNSIGLIWDHLGNNTEALKCFDAALTLRKKIQDQSGEASTLNNIGMVWLKLEDYIQALDYFQSALALLDKLEEAYSIAWVNSNIGIAYFRLERLSEAIPYLKRAVDVGIKFQHPALEAFKAYLAEAQMMIDSNHP